VLRLLDFGAIVQVLPARRICCTSAISHERVTPWPDHLKEGQVVR